MPVLTRHVLGSGPALLLPLTTKMPRPSGRPAMAVGYHPVGIRPTTAERSALGASSSSSPVLRARGWAWSAALALSRITATSFSPPLVTSRVRPSGDSARPLDPAPPSLDKPSATPAGARVGI